ncbi:hypothetical protein PAPYR_4293 [Paratrimastix pyriformis]|uniref:Uncharacterized protein n=1 Tax=Paratrimastix pyriformis TaxID=342808 RepID=A0ABQ8UPD1_9EUKA|nr:hypothetical protein PAPYR_4293 [Paratrimastix pyriformis]
MHFCQFTMKDLKNLLSSFYPKQDKLEIQQEHFYQISELIMRRCCFLQSLQWDFLSFAENGLVSPPDRIHVLFRGIRGTLFDPREVDQFLAARDKPFTGVSLEEFADYICSRLPPTLSSQNPNAPGRPVR